MLRIPDLNESLIHAGKAEWPAGGAWSNDRACMFFHGFRYLPGHFSPLGAGGAGRGDPGRSRCRPPLHCPAMPKTGQPMSVRMTNCGALGWVTDKDGGYRYQAPAPA